MRALLKNSSYLLIAQSFVKVISFLYTIFLARSLGVEDFGLYVVALSYFSLIGSVADFGITRYLTKEAARGTTNLTNLLSSILVLRLSTISVIFALFALGFYVYDPNKLRVALTLFAIMAVIPQSIALTFDSVFIALQRVSFSALGLLILSIFTAFFGVILVNSGYGPQGAIAALIFGQIIYAVYLIAMIFLKNINFISHPPDKIFKEILVGSLPYGLLGVLGLVYFKIDTILLSYLKGPYDTGLYGAAYKFLEAIIFVPSALSTTLFPVIARLHDEDISKVRYYYYQSLKILFFASILILVGYLFILPIFVTMFLPNYIPSILAIQILAFTIPFMFTHTPAALVLLSTDKYVKPVIYLSFLMLGFNIVLNLIMIPILGYIGASIVTVLSEALSLITFYVLLKRTILKNDSNIRKNI